MELNERKAAAGSAIREVGWPHVPWVVWVMTKTVFCSECDEQPLALCVERRDMIYVFISQSACWGMKGLEEEHEQKHRSS